MYTCPENIHIWDRVLYEARPATHYVAQTTMDLVILQPQSPKCWDYRCVPPYIS
jgi:hypothetical protein